MVKLIREERISRVFNFISICIIRWCVLFQEKGVLEFKSAELFYTPPLFIMELL